MSKKNKNPENEVMRNTYTNVPSVMNMDDIGYLTDDALVENLTRMEFERAKMIESRQDPMLWEVEIAYLRREQGIRKVRAERHQEYVKMLISSGEYDFSYEAEYKNEEQSASNNLMN